MPPADTVTVTIEVATMTVARAFASMGMPTDLATEGAAVIVDTESRGQSTHGLSIVPQYLRRLGNGEIDPVGRPVVTSQAGAVALIDGQGSLGHLGASLASRTAGDLAVEFGVGLATVHRSNHAGAIGAYARMLAARGLIGLVLASSVPSMRAPGGTARVLGNNPLAIAYPTLQQPVVLDMAMSTVARRRISLAAEDGSPIPSGWARDSSGAPTLDAVAALQGTLEPFGGDKSAALGVVVGLLATGLSGAAMGPEMGDLEVGPRPGVDGLTVIAVSTTSFEADPAVRSRASRSTAALRAGDDGETDAAVRLPGDNSARQHARSVSTGITVNRRLWEHLAAHD